MESTTTTTSRRPKGAAGEGPVTLTQMFKALDKDVAGGVARRLRKLAKKKAIRKPLDKPRADQVERQVAYSSVSKEISKWDPIVEQNRKARHLSFPLDEQPDVLPSTADAILELKPANEFERVIQSTINTCDTALRDNKGLSKAEQDYLKSISAEEAAERHKELQRLRVLLNSFAAKMRRQKRIKSKSYRRLLKKDRIRTHLKKVESDKDLLVQEIERLRKLRAQERASLKHKSSGKWAKHAKFRAKYDEAARQAMLEQMGLAKKLTERPAELSDSEDGLNSEEEDSDDDDDGSVVSVSSAGSASKSVVPKVGPNPTSSTSDQQLIISNELINSRLAHRTRPNKSVDVEMDSDDGGETSTDGEGDSEDEQRKLMSEAFADDDVVAEFRRAKDELANEEQPKDQDKFLPGWGDWAGPGTKVNKRKRKKYLIKAKKVPRRDENLGNVIIAEKADAKIRRLQPKKLPRGLNNEAQLGKVILKPTAASFVDQTTHRAVTKPRIQTRLGARLEPISGRLLSSNRTAKWSKD